VDHPDNPVLLAQRDPKRGAGAAELDQRSSSAAGSIGKRFGRKVTKLKHVFAVQQSTERRTLPRLDWAQAE